MNDYKFGNFIYTLRVENGLTQAEVAQRLGVSAAAVSKWENGSTKPRYEMLLKLAEIFQVSTEELINGEKADREPLEQEPINQDPPQKKKTIWIVVIIALALIALCVCALLVLKNSASVFDGSSEDAVTSAEQSKETSSESPVSSNTSSKKQSSSKTSSKTVSTYSNKENSSPNVQLLGIGGVLVDGDWAYYYDSSYVKEDVSGGYKYKAKDGIYKSRHDGSNKTRLVEGNFRCVNILDGWLYYKASNWDTINSGLYRIRTDGSKQKKICDGTLKSVCFVGNWIYYLDNGVVSRVYTDGSNVQVFSPAITGKCMSIEGNTIYTCNGELFQQVNVDGTGYKSYPLKDVTYFIVNDGWIYYPKNDRGIAIYYKASLDLSETTELIALNGEYSTDYLYVVDDWLYFPNVEDEKTKYRVKTDGSGEIELVN